MPHDAKMVHINTGLIPPWVAEDLAEQLYNSVRNYFSIPENQAKFEKWKRLRAIDTQVCSEGQTADDQNADFSAALINRRIQDERTAEARD